LATDAPAPEAPVVQAPAKAILELDGIVAGYGRTTILNGVNFTVKQCAITTIIGPNGAGKSTVFKVVFGLLRAREGKVRFAGKDITNAEPRRLLAQGVCYVPQGRNVFPELTVRHNLDLAGVAADRGIAEDPGDRPRPAAGPQAGADRRAVDRPVAADGAGGLRGAG
jgi:ABC-type branched-subunit amino acid transport system ATPase component